jgi:hypothetical protein
MTVTRAHVEFAKRIGLDRIGDAYVYGGSWDPADVHDGCDCSGEVTDELGAVYFGTQMHWDREGLSTESYRDRPPGAQTVGPFAGLVHVTQPGDVPADAAVKIGIHHEGAGGPQSHMWCEVDGVRFETNGTLGTCTGPVARAFDDSYANDWWYLPGPVVEDGTPRTDLTTVTQPADTLFADVSEFQAPVTNAYTDAGYRWLSIRTNDGTHRDAHFAQNYAWCKAAADAGLITGFMVYYYWRPNGTGLATHMAMVNEQGGPHPKMVSMIDLESGGNPGGDQSRVVNGELARLQDWLGDPRRVIGYGNSGDLKAMWPGKAAATPVIVAGYGANPSYPGKIAHQYTDGNGYGGGLPEGAPPFGKCDMNSADGFSPTQLADALGVGGTPGGISMSDADSLKAEFDGLALNLPGFTNGQALPWRNVHLLRDAQIGDLATQTDGDAELPNASPSVFDQTATLAKILTRRYKGHDVFDMLALIGDHLGVL